MTDRIVRLGAGAGFSGDRLEPALDLLEHGKLDYLAFECLAERTIGLAQAARMENPEGGYDVHLDERMSRALPLASANCVRIISNMGAANSIGAARRISEIARELGLSGYKTAAVVGDDVLDLVTAGNFALTDRDGSTLDIRDLIVSANAYLGVEHIVEALRLGADTVITGRVCDPALFLAPLVHEFDWRMDDWDMLGQGTVIGHLLECAGQLCGGYFADPGFKDVPDLARLGFPFADVSSNGFATFGKLAQSGGRLDAQVCKEQLLYEILDPSAYIQADVTSDFRSVVIDDLSSMDGVRVSGGLGRPRPDTLKVSITYEDGYMGEGQISFAGPGCVSRGRLALEIVRERLQIIDAQVHDLRCELIGIDSVDKRSKVSICEPAEVRARVSGRAGSQRAAERIGAEVEALYTNGPAGGGGVTRAVRKVLAVASTLLDRRVVRPRVEIKVA